MHKTKTGRKIRKISAGIQKNGRDGFWRLQKRLREVDRSEMHFAEVGGCGGVGPVRQCPGGFRGNHRQNVYSLVWTFWSRFSRRWEKGSDMRQSRNRCAFKIDSKSAHSFFGSSPRWGGKKQAS